MTLFDVFAKREADDTGLPKQASDAELLAWSDHIRSLPTDDDDFVVVDLRAEVAATPAPVPARTRRRALVAAPEPHMPRRVLRARPLVASPVSQLD